MDKTIEYYENNAADFASSTIDVPMESTQERFLERIEKGAYILDFGCGAGRDTKYFLSKGYRVDATDGSEELCKIASRNTGINVRRLLFTELCEKDLYDAIWACSSILHLDRRTLAEVFYKMHSSLKDNGIVYTSFKYGEFEGYRNGRYFIDFTKETFNSFLSDCGLFSLVDEWVTSDARPGRGDEKWLNLILKKD